MPCVHTQLFYFIMFDFPGIQHSNSIVMHNQRRIVGIKQIDQSKILQTGQDSNAASIDATSFSPNTNSPIDRFLSLQYLVFASLVCFQVSNNALDEVHNASLRNSITLSVQLVLAAQVSRSCNMTLDSSFELNPDMPYRVEIWTSSLPVYPYNTCLP